VDTEVTYVDVVAFYVVLSARSARSRVDAYSYSSLDYSLLRYSHTVISNRTDVPKSGRQIYIFTACPVRFSSLISVNLYWFTQRSLMLHFREEA
jgi:hypothetical protein